MASTVTPKPDAAPQSAVAPSSCSPIAEHGLSGKQGTFLICSFWLVSALAIVGERQRARDLMERVASPLGLERLREIPEVPAGVGIELLGVHDWDADPAPPLVAGPQQR